MIQSLIRHALRIAILALIALPILVPFIESHIQRTPPKNLTVWMDVGLPSDDRSMQIVERNLREKIHIDSDVNLNFRRFGSPRQTPLQDFEELITFLNSASGENVIISNAALWGPPARHFQRELSRLSRSSNRKILYLQPEDVQLSPRRTTPKRFLALSELSAPQLNFLGEPTQMSLDIVGRLNPGENHSFEVVIRSGDALLTSKTVSVTADANGLVNSIENVPVHFTRAQQQLLTAQLSSDLSPVPLNMASTPVNVVHSKSTVLHIGVGPDWSLRNMRTKLKFWPNLDLLSYYILREVTDDLSIPSNQLSLIEFPAEKLFGEQLPNFHGVLAQNFVFDTYLNSRDTENLFNYVSVNGGRLVIQAGPLSFLGRDSRVNELFPCENVPEFDFENQHRWKVGKNRFLSEAQFESAVSQIVTRQTALGCKPKDGALVLAETDDKQASPMIVAYPVGKGLVVAILAGDWHTFGSQWDASTSTQNAHRVYAVDASERLFQWMVEFLQRRQDSGLRPPVFAGPRVYANDPLHLVRSRGGLPDNSLLRGLGQGFSVLLGRPVWMSNLTLEAVAWERWNSPSDLPPSDSRLLGPGRDQTRAPTFTSVGLTWQAVGEGSATNGSNSSVNKQLVWPIFEGTMREREDFHNPALFSGDFTQLTKDWAKSLAQTENIKEHRPIPLLNAYPWLLALVLFLFALEQLLGRLMTTARRPAAPGGQ